MGKQPNILLRMTDQMRGDCLGITGHPDVKTPYLDSLADKERCIPMRTPPVLIVQPAPFHSYSGDLSCVAFEG